MFDLETKIAMLKACDDGLLPGIGRRAAYMIAPKGHDIETMGWPEKMCYDLYYNEAEISDDTPLYTEDCKGNYKVVDILTWTFDCCPLHNKEQL